MKDERPRVNCLLCKQLRHIDIDKGEVFCDDCVDEMEQMEDEQ